MRRMKLFLILVSASTVWSRVLSYTIQRSGKSYAFVWSCWGFGVSNCIVDKVGLILIPPEHEMS